MTRKILRPNIARWHHALLILETLRFNLMHVAACYPVRTTISKTSPLFFIALLQHYKCSEIAAALNDFSNRWCKREHVEPDAMKKWKINIFKIIDTRISFYSRNTHILPSKPISSFRHLKRGIQNFHMNYVLVQADKGADNIVIVSLLTPMPINCNLLRVRGWLSMGMVIIQPYILVSKLKKIKTKFLRCTGYLNAIKTI